MIGLLSVPLAIALSDWRVADASHSYPLVPNVDINLAHRVQVYLRGLPTLCARKGRPPSTLVARAARLVTLSTSHREVPQKNRIRLATRQSGRVRDVWVGEVLGHGWRCALDEKFRSAKSKGATTG
jgi:hypothetical protein